MLSVLGSYMIRSQGQHRRSVGESESPSIARRLGVRGRPKRPALWAREQ